MSNMLGKTKPFDLRDMCCSKHGGPPNMTPKRKKEERQWRKDADEQMNTDRRTVPTLS